MEQSEVGILKENNIIDLNNPKQEVIDAICIIVAKIKTVIDEIVNVSTIACQRSFETLKETIDSLMFSCSSPRVKHLALRAKKYRTRKKNFNRIRKSFNRLINRGAS